MITHDTKDEQTNASKDARLAVVEEHVKRENQHNLDRIMATFGEDAWYADEPWGDHHRDRGGVRAYYEDLLRAVPDLQIDVKRRHVTAEHVILEVVISGTHAGSWRGLPGTGRQIAFPLCAVYTFDDRNKLAGERIYYDWATVLRQLGIFRDPDSGLGRVLTPLAHPMTIARLLTRKLRS